MIKAGIIGAAGYTGGEVIRILLQHPEVEIVFAQSKSQAGKSLSSVHQDLLGDTELIFTNHHSDADILFICSGHGDSRKFLEENAIPLACKIIDLSHDFRLKEKSALPGRQFVYGLPELNREKIVAASNVANPGCFATALQLGLLPLVASGFSGIVYATGITGATGAGQALATTSHFSWRANNIQAYKSLTHQHIAEVSESLQQASPSGKAPALHLVPWRGDFPRGIFASQQLVTTFSLEQLQRLYREYYRTHPFVHLAEDVLHLKQVVHTNKCIIGLEQHNGQTVIHTAIDNLLKGASGQAVQNMNLMFGLEEATGLKLKAGYF